MVASVASWLILFLGLALLWLLSSVYFKQRGICNRVAAAAATEFNKSSDKLLLSASELPEAILDALYSMYALAADPSGQRHLLSAIKERNSEPKDPGYRDFVADLDSLRPETRELFSQTVVAWLNFVSNRSVLMQLRIGAVLASEKLASDPTEAQRRTGMRLISNFEAAQC